MVHLVCSLYHLPLLHLAAAQTSHSLQHPQQQQQHQQQQRRCQRSYQYAATGENRSQHQAPAALKLPAATACHLSGNSQLVTAPLLTLQQQQQQQQGWMCKTAHLQTLIWQMLEIPQIQTMTCMM
jgi:hypothetical protein